MTTQRIDTRPYETTLFSTLDVARRTGTSVRQVDYWCRLGVLIPAIEANGSGTYRRFDEREARVVGVLASLAPLGFALGALGASVAEQLRALDEMTGLLLIRSNGTISRATAGSGWLVDLDENHTSAAA